MANLKGILDSIRRDMWQDTGLNGDAQRIEQLGWMLFFKIFSDTELYNRVVVTENCGTDFGGIKALLQPAIPRMESLVPCK